MVSDPGRLAGLDTSAGVASGDDGDLTDLLGELRVLLPTAQLLSAFLITVPFTPRFVDIVDSEKYAFLVTFLLSVASLVLLSGPAVQHRLMRPLIDRGHFKRVASRQIVLGSVMLGVALVFATHLVLSEVLGNTIGNIAAGFLASLIVLVWWVLPKVWKRRDARL